MVTERNQIFGYAPNSEGKKYKNYATALFEPHYLWINLYCIICEIYWLLHESNIHVQSFTTRCV
jgi:hypothetical protein